ncbi:MAG: Lipoprotein [Pedobacter sp.]|jgi:rare lipoprotein A|nr:Lipoprotein [Pedobacter sp.]
MKYCLLILTMLLFYTAQGHEETANINPDVNTKKGVATYYARRFEGRRTTSGRRYKGHKLTAAHRTLPFGTIVSVKNLTNGKMVDVVVNDRGPYTKRYIIDLSESAAKELGFWRKGESKVEISYKLP